MNHQQSTEKDEIRARFTVWLETTIYRARLKYLERQSKQVQTISLEDLSEEALATPDTMLYSDSSKSAFDFEEERLAEAFAKLPIKRLAHFYYIFTTLCVRDRECVRVTRY